MGEATKIQWADHTFNPWRGCTKIAPGCANCYAEANARRNPGVFGAWGDSGTRVVAAESTWKKPVKWNRMAGGEWPHGWPSEHRPRVFCASLADVFEDRPELVEPRQRMFGLIDETQNLDWLLLTKRPENVRRMWPRWGVLNALHRSNVWLGVSIACQDDADRLIPELLKCRHLAANLFLSVEPLIGPVDLTRLNNGGGERYDALRGEVRTIGGNKFRASDADPIDWVIVGGESGKKARPCDIAWIRLIVKQCKNAGVPVFVKQAGACVHASDAIDPLDQFPGSPKFTGIDHRTIRVQLRDRKGGDPAEWPEDLQVREMPR